MLGKRPRTMMKRTSSVSLIGSAAGKEDGSRLPEHPKEKQNNCSVAAPAPAPPRQVIGFHPKIAMVAPQQQQQLEPVSSSSPLCARGCAGQAPPLPPSGKPSSPSGSPRSGLGDLLAGTRSPWERKQAAAQAAAAGGVGLSIVAALSDGVGPKCEEADARKPRAPAPHERMAMAFAPARASPPIPILLPPPPPNSGGFARPAHCARPAHGGAIAAYGASWSHQQQLQLHADVMEVDRVDPFAVMMAPAPFVQFALHTAPVPSSGLEQNFLDSCHLCRRRLGEGRDIYIYRGDKAFCSPECRHQQIVNDERPEKCSSAVMKVRGTDSRSSNQRSRAIAAGTAAAA